MPGQPGFPNLTAMRGRRKGGAPTPQARPLEGIAAHANAFLAQLSARAYSQASIEAHRWALRQFTAWADTRGTHDPAAFIRGDIEAFQLFLHHYRSPRGGKPLVTKHPACPARLHPSLLRLALPLWHHPRQAGAYGSLTS